MNETWKNIFSFKMGYDGMLSVKREQQAPDEAVLQRAKSSIPMLNLSEWALHRSFPEGTPLSSAVVH